MRQRSAKETSSDAPGEGATSRGIGTESSLVRRKALSLGTNGSKKEENLSLIMKNKPENKPQVGTVADTVS